ncbi:enoyl-CoA hydratase/isomerase family protein [uncultured Algibacter sp.]|uniref:enoyl-CoA hydratase/isomerase family protein n=1 Tax=uncultured Algibacter sp. TaxID=298659 RepID=UPI00261414E8|nr:enoyl-CoA hydratase/isomerase family protein [uncultured Algibacter sp.]
MEPYVTLTIENSIGYIEFFHPDHNAMPSDNLKKLEEIIVKADNDDDIKVIVLKSGGDRTFCAGASFKELISIDNEEDGKQFFLGFANLINTMRKCSKLIIGRVQGKAVGGGVGLAAATDYCLATKYASIKLSELSIGIGPFVIEPAVSRKMGKTTMSQMTIDAESFFSAEFANDKGLYANVYKSMDALDNAVRDLANKLVSYNPEALKEMKTVFWKGTENWDALLDERAKISGNLVLSAFTKETLKRFNQ